MFAMATGDSPFEGDNAMAVLRKIIDDEPPALATLRPEIPEVVQNLIGDLLQKNPDARPDGAQEIVERLEGMAR